MFNASYYMYTKEAHGYVVRIVAWSLAHLVAYLVA